MNWLRIGAGMFLGIVAALGLLAAAVSSRPHYFSYRQMFAAWLGYILAMVGVVMLVVLCALAFIELSEGHL